MNNNRIAVILLSGGIDSATTAAVAKRDGYLLFALTFAYGQKHDIEIKFAKHLLLSLSIKNHIVIEIPSIIFSSSALLNKSKIEMPKNRDVLAMDDIPVTYVPARNILFLSYSIAYAESLGASDIFIGANSIDYSGYPDCRPEFFMAYENMANIGTKAGVMGKKFTIHTPLIDMKKSQIICLGKSLGIDYSLTHSCYDPDELGSSCGECDSCIIRKRGFLEAGFLDPTKYRKNTNVSFNK